MRRAFAAVLNSMYEEDTPTMTKRMKQDVAYWMLKLALRLCRWSGLTNPKGLAMDAAGDIGWKS